MLLTYTNMLHSVWIHSLVEYMISNLNASGAQNCNASLKLRQT